jgi:uncharacterized protein (TIGR00369 family)
VTVLEIIAAARAANDPAPLLAAIPYAQFLGLSATIVGDEVITEMAYGPHLVGNPALPALHGGTLGALLESAAVFSLLWAADATVLPKTITITVDYLRSAGPRPTFSCGIITRLGRRVASMRAIAWQEDRNQLVATAHAHFLIAARAPVPST